MYVNKYVVYVIKSDLKFSEKLVPTMMIYFEHKVEML